jgi:hypothetical protein
MKWKPIESAPKDGTVILGHDPDWVDPVLIMYFDAEKNKWEYLFPEDWPTNPTHWMPMLKPPKEQ